MDLNLYIHRKRDYNRGLKMLLRGKWWPFVCLQPCEEWLVECGPAINYAKFTALNANNLETLAGRWHNESVQSLTTIDHHHRSSGERWASWHKTSLRQVPPACKSLLTGHVKCIVLSCFQNVWLLNYLMVSSAFHDALLPRSRTRPIK